ncbi:MAG: DUF1569 domain-containing protein [Opitutaceae bacterium]|nr:DUF1569 domain-containing protein [Verrucomicrobiales bacterium]
MIDTRTVQDRRTLRFNSIKEVIADADRIAAAERAGTLRTTGNWTAGQTFGHLAAWANYPYDGYPAALRPPWILKTLLKLFLKNKFIKGPMRPGVRIFKVSGGTLGIDPLPLEVGLEQLRNSHLRLDATCPPLPNVLMGPLTHEQWRSLGLRHAELHLSFLHP